MRLLHWVLHSKFVHRHQRKHLGRTLGRLQFMSMVTSGQWISRPVNGLTWKPGPSQLKKMCLRSPCAADPYIRRLSLQQRPRLKFSETRCARNHLNSSGTHSFDIIRGQQLHRGHRVLYSLLIKLCDREGPALTKTWLVIRLKIIRDPSLSILICLRSRAHHQPFRLHCRE